MLDPSQQPAQRAGPSKPEALRAALERQLRQRESRTPPPPDVPDHHLIHLIGSGAYGEVWLARSALGRARAVKIVHRANFKEDRPYQREFEGILKYEPISRSHPGLVQVLHVGRDDSAACFYYVMELADPVSLPEKQAQSLSTGPLASTYPDVQSCQGLTDYQPRTLRSELAHRRRLPPADAAQLAMRLTNALSHLHAHGLVHRDVKPSNVIFVDSQPKLADIGLVTDAGDSRSFVGTEGFIPPEGPGTPQADLFSLGKLLYELATGRDRLDFPQLPQAIAAMPDGEALLDLNEVLARACAPDPQARYAAGSELEADLNLFLAGRSLRQVRRIERTLARFKRHALISSILALIALIGFWFAHRQHRLDERRAATETTLRARAEAAETEARQQLHTALLAQARATTRSHALGHRLQTLDAVRRAAAISNNPALRREAFTALALPDLRLEKEIPFAQEETGWAFDPAFHRYAIGKGRGPVEIRAVSDQSLHSSFPPVNPLEAYVLQWSPDGRYLAVKRDHDSGGNRADLEVWDFSTTQRVLHAQGQVTRNALCFHPQLPQVMTGRQGGQVNVWNLRPVRLKAHFQLPSTPWSVCYAPDGTRFAASYDLGSNHLVAIHRMSDGALISTTHSPGAVRVLAWQPQGRYLAAPDTDGNVHLIDSTTGQAQLLGQHRAQAANAVFSPDGHFLITGGWENALICWNVQTLQRAMDIGIPSYDLRFGQDGTQCATRTKQGLQIWQFQSPTCVRELADSIGPTVKGAAFSPDGRWLAVNGDLGIGLWELPEAGIATVVPAQRTKIPVFSADSSQLYSFCEDFLLRWRIKTTTSAEPPHLEALPIETPEGLRTVSRSGSQLVLTGRSGVRLCDTLNAQTSMDTPATAAQGWGVSSLEGRWLAVWNLHSPLIRVYQLPELTEKACLTNRADVWAMSFSPDGSQLAAGTSAGLTLYDTSDWLPTHEIAVPCVRQCKLIYQPDGHALWFSPDGHTAALHDARTLQVLLPLPTGTVPLAVSPDGKHLAAVVESRRLQLWDMFELRRAFRDLGIDWSNARHRRDDQ